MILSGHTDDEMGVLSLEVLGWPKPMRNGEWPLSARAAVRQGDVRQNKSFRRCDVLFFSLWIML